MTETEQRVLDAIPYGGCSLTAVYRRAGVSRTTAMRALARMEERGLVERLPNPHGPETPWWYSQIPAAPDGFDASEIVTAKDTIYDRGRTTDKTWILLTGEVNEHGCAVAWLFAGPHSQRKVYVPLHELAASYTRRRRGEVTAWSEQFSCSVHGECTEDMITTAKTCSLCGLLLNRLGPQR